MPKKSSTAITEVPGYAVLPVKLPPASSSFPKPVTHYVYLRPHEPRIPDADTARSLFLVNVPVDTTELHLRHLFSSQLSAGRVERVHFEGVFSRSNAVTTHAPTTNTAETLSSQQGKKRKRQDVVTSQELETQLRSAGLPSTWDRELHTSGTHAIVTFVDRPAMEASLKAVRKFASKERKSPIIWGEGIEDRLPALGITRYRKHASKIRYPSADELLSIVNNYMALYTQWEETRALEVSRRAAEPDEDGFITVTRGPRFTDVAREDEVKELVEKQRKREEGLGDFYRFQTREKRKERQNELLRRFDEDKRKIEKLKKSRGRIMPEGM
ncbi:ribosomal small subunit assembly protein, putative [Talaromyces stipitatus ATCC 10500]|uniref:Ribosomal small subunit assembly protein, putative n=1 Tax=Talaromyces stipitatus (strain ATCC 10500 / CBS 375.48 / QM 6759 / NRRL 1006) TaxID=441959 RepID=B8MTZ2_TALSN|nr:RRP7 superfamily domain-containing protein [Talaromyces stipitatus ATCC 10500]EED12625.1 ribosomal small subunit assembly protein, putative [Talaromyces stipitatus ATCC 10500]